MKGFIRKRISKDGSKTNYQVVVKTPDGRQRSLGTWRLKKDAEARLKRAESGRGAGTGASTFGEFYAESWLPAKCKNLKPASLRDMEAVMKNHILPRFASTRLEDITPKKVQDWVTALAGKDMSPATVGKIYRYFRGAMRQAETWGEVGYNPCRGIILPRSDRGELDYLEPKEVLSLLECAREEPERSLFTLLAWSGLRLGEGLALAWRHIDFDKDIIRVERSLGEGGIFQDPKTSSSRRAVPMIPSLAGMLHDRYIIAGRPSPDTLLFSIKGIPLDPGNTRRQLYKALESAGLRHVTIHSLRHTFASGMLASGASIKALQRSLGHASATMTLNVYSHMIEESLDPVLFKADNLFTGSSGKVIPFPKSEESGSER